MLYKKVLAGGCFNHIHPGHIYFLQTAKKLGQEFTLILTNDANNKKPYAVPAKERIKMIEFLNIADKILVGDPRDKMKILEETKPDIIALGYDQKLPWGLREPNRINDHYFVLKFDSFIPVVRIKKFGRYSTQLIKTGQENEFLRHNKPK